MILRGYLKNGGKRRRVLVNHMSDLLRIMLRDENDIDVVSLDEGSEAIFDLAQSRVLVHDEEVGLAVPVDLADATEQEADAGVFIADYGNQLASGRGVRHGSANLQSF